MIKLKDAEGKPQSGLAMKPDGTEAVVEFCLKGRDTYIDIHDQSTTLIPPYEINLLPVRLIDGSRLTFIDNIVTSSTSYHGHGGNVMTFLPHFVFIGSESLTADYQLDSISFSIEDATAVFYDFDAFSIALTDDEKIKAIIDEQAEQIGRPIEVGEHPILAYFTGKYEIVIANTAVGVVSAHHRPSHGMGGPRGVSIKNKIAIQIDFQAPTQIGGAIECLMPVLRFLQVIAGRKQKITDLRAKLHGTDHQGWQELLWCLPWSGSGEGQRPHPADLPVNGGYEPEAFANVLEAWLAVDDHRRDARIRFSESFSRENNYSIDRLVSAANMFDILPSSCFEKLPTLPAELKDARDGARKLFKALPQSDIRDRALGDLGRLDQLNLKAKVQQRAAKVLKLDPGKFPNLEEVLNKAVDARNHYVHGAPADAGKIEFFQRMLSFHVDALEFIFAASDLLDAGWAYDVWASKGTTMSHPFGTFRASYASRAADYMEQLAALA